uniref:starch-binding protein n=1 Tax=Acetatifactor sp. TaxID=1872090 RepID=UPI004056B9D5
MKKSFVKKAITYVLAVCMLVTTLFAASGSIVQAEGQTTVYFQNSQGWAQVGTYVYNAPGYEGNGEALGAWPGVMAEEASDLGNGWVSVTVPAETAFNIIFFNPENDAERAELQIADVNNVYVTMSKKTYSSKEAAESAMADTPTTVYFLNSNGWDEVYAYPYADNQPLDTEWPGVAAEEAPEAGDNWWKTKISQNALINPFNIIFNNNSDSQVESAVNRFENNYMTASGELYATMQEAEVASGVAKETIVYFLNSKDWANVGAYVYGVGEVLGPWPGKIPEEAPEMGEKWMKIAVPAKPAFSIIFFNKASEGERAELQLPSAEYVYVTGSNEVYASAEEAELAEGLGDQSKMTEVFFYNSRGWGDINTYVYVIDEEGVGSTLGKGWPGGAAEAATELGENWWKFSVPREATEENPFYVIFNDGVNQTGDILISNKDVVYANATNNAYASVEEAEAAAANDTYDDGCEDGPNTDLEAYDVKLKEAGATLPYVTYEAEDANTNAQVLEKSTVYREAIQSEASGRQAVMLQNEGDYVEFTLEEDANSLVLRYSIPDSEDGTGMDAGLSMYVDEEEVKGLELTSEYAWVYGGFPYNNNPANDLPHRYFDEIRTTFDETLPKGTVIRFQKDAEDTAEFYVIDFVDCELVAEPLAQPENSLSVVDFGAVADDGQDDRAAFEACIEAATAEDKEVWIPAGTFNLDEEKIFDLNGVTIRGAGMWHTNLVGAGVSFHYKGTCKFYDFAMTGVSTVRDDSGDLAGFEGSGARSTNVTIQNIWMEHMKVGVWSCNTENLVVQGCRIRNTYADGMNLCSGTVNAVVRNNNVRTTGDDCIAIWPWLANCENNTIEHNTIMAPDLANGIAIYGGGGHVVDSNYVSEIINNGSGICVGSEFDTKEGYTGTITVTNNVLDRCGSMQTDENYPIGAIWLWSSWNPMMSAYDIHGNELNDCSYEGVLIECDSQLTGVTVKDIDINGATDAIFIRGNGPGEAVIGNIDAENITGEMIRSANPKVLVSEQNDAEHGRAIALVMGVLAVGAGGTIVLRSKRKKVK